MHESSHTDEVSKTEQSATPVGQTMSFQLTPGKMFLLGIVGGVMTLCTIGFFIMLGMYVNNGLPQSAGTDAVPTVAANPNAVAPTPTEPAANVNIKPVDEKNDHIKGPKNAKITIVEYSDFECPYCQKFHNETLAQVMTTYKNDVRLVYRHFPLDFHKQAMPAALASECASEQGKFWEMHDLLFQEGVVQTGSYSEYAKKIGLNVGKFDTCFKDQKYIAKIQADQQGGSEAGVRGTPFSVIMGPNGKKVPISGAYPFSMVDSEIKTMLQ